MTAQIGVFICDCKGQVSDRIDTAHVAEVASSLDDVAFVDRREMLCGDADLGAALAHAKEQGCNRVLFGACSPRSSLKFPEERIATLMGGLGMDPSLFEIANVREQCAWQHSDRDEATRKATDLVRMAHARLRTDEPAPGAVPIPRRALVIGAGPAGLQAAKDLAAAGIDVTLADRQSWVGGHLCQLQRIFQSEAWPSVCDASCVGPVQAKGAMLDDRVDVRTQTEVVEAERRDGAFRVTLESQPKYVDPDLCISCAKCTEVCPESAPRGYDRGFSQRKAIDKEFERALPDLYTLLKDACTFCGDCVPVCPTDAIDLEAESRCTTDDYGAVFLATGFDQADLSGYPTYLNQHPNVVNSLEFERLLAGGLKRPSDGEEPERVIFVQCAGSRASTDRDADGVAYCSKTCCSITAKQVDRVLTGHPMVEPMVLYYRDMRTYERALETLYQRLRITGVEFVNGELTGIEASDDGTLSLAVEPLCGAEDDAEEPPAEVRMEADLVVLAAAQTPAAGVARLHRMLGVEVDKYGYPVENQPRLFRPTESMVNRVFTVGAGSGPKVVQHAAEQGSAAAMRALPDLLQGSAAPLRYASRVNPDLCTGCRTCETVCPHGAIQVKDSVAVSDPAFCQACGFCAAACPVHAVELVNFTDEQILAQARVAFEDQPSGDPRILALLCYWCAYSAADFAGVERVESISNHRVIRIRCSSSVNTGLLMEMFKLGIDGIVVGGCPERSCHHLWGNFVADKRIELARAMLGQLGLSPSRLRFEYIGAPMQAKLMDVLKQMDGKLRPLGPNPAARDASLSGHGR